MTGFPGLRTAMDGRAFTDPEHCRDTIKGLVELGANSLLVLVEREELEDLAFEVLEQICAAMKVTVSYQSITDYSVPNHEFSEWWASHRPDREAVFAAGGTMAFACQYGAGRSGMMAALCLIEQGVAPDDAMARVRDAFPPAVESDAQEAWLRNRGDG
ncbi:hypothetical protein V8J82_16960 [Gymnodinialimonas sp. 2305UL16-5]|uniref:hypothetical protein n=1 Tax=Gymnodinialimonas mytili TaxID=3126503 RepID=UPI0030A59DE8